MSSGWMTAMAALLGSLAPVISAAWYLSSVLSDLKSGVEGNQKGIDSIEDRIEKLDERIRANSKQAEINDRAIHDHLLQVNDTENPLNIGEDLCPFCEEH